MPEWSILGKPQILLPAVSDLQATIPYIHSAVNYGAIILIL